jgi:hypothetical protein
MPPHRFQTIQNGKTVPPPNRDWLHR